MKSFFKNLQSKSPEERRKMAFVGALCVTVFIFTIWFTAGIAINNLETESQSAGSISPWSDLKEVFAPLLNK